MSPAVVILRGLIAIVAALTFALPAQALPRLKHLTTYHEIRNLNRELSGQVLDFTHNHDGDHRIWSAALGAKRDLYIYLPPGYDGITAFPVMIWLHGFGQDEKAFLTFAAIMDKGIRAGLFPPIIMAAPDGSIGSGPALTNNGSFFMNSKSGRYQDYVIEDVWCFLQRTFRIRPEREAHVIAGASMGGYAAYNLGFQNRELFGVIAGMLPALDIRYADCHDNYFSAYNPDCVMERDNVQRHRVIGRFLGGLVHIHERRLTDPILGRHPADGLKPLAPYNPVEQLESLQIQPGEFKLFIGYAGRDEFNLAAQTEHFLDVARRRGIQPMVAYVPDGLHRTSTGKLMVPAFSEWLCKALSPYLPKGGCEHCGESFNLLKGKAVKPVYTPFGILSGFDPPPAGLLNPK